MIDHDDAPRGIEFGQPGASARAEFERRRRRDASARRRRFGRVLAPVVALVIGIRPSTARWRVGGEAEERVGRLLSAAVGDAGVVLHDRAVPGGRANIDHIAVVPSGVWVIDTKRYHGRVRRVGQLGRLVSDAAASSSTATTGATSSTLPCVSVPLWQRPRGRWRRCVPPCASPTPSGGPWARPFALRGVTVASPGALAAALGAPGPLGRDEQSALSLRLARSFPPYGDPGASRRRAKTEPDPE
jgi:hypothetical protein